MVSRVAIRKAFFVLMISCGLFTFIYASLYYRNPKFQKRSARWIFENESDYLQAKQSIWTNLTHLVIVPGHAIHSCHSIQELYSANCWFLLPYQAGQHSSFIKHIQLSIDLAISDSHAMLVFSGGQTRAPVGPISEAHAYHQAALMLTQEDVIKRMFLEEHARDSLENIAFSLCRFHEVTGQYPAMVTVFGFPFKRKRFIELHWPQVQSRLPHLVHFKYVSVNDGDLNGVDDAYNLFKQDPMGIGEVLSAKRNHRNPFNLSIPYKCPFINS